MKNTFILALVGIACLVGFSSSAALTQTTTLAAGTQALLIPTNNSCYISQITYQATTATAASASIWDSPSSAQTYVVPAYTNIISYATNYVTSWTNYYGVATSLTNIALVDVTNPVTSVTNSYVNRFSAGVPASTSAQFDNVNSAFQFSPWATNTGSGTIAITVTFIPIGQR